MAKGVNVKQQNWARWENDVVTPSAEMIAKICRVHACSADWLLGLKGEGEERGVERALPAGERCPSCESSQPGSLPQCAKCEYKAKVKKFEALLSK